MQDRAQSADAGSPDVVRSATPDAIEASARRLAPPVWAVGAKRPEGEAGGRPWWGTRRCRSNGGGRECRQPRRRSARCQRPRRHSPCCPKRPEGVRSYRLPVVRQTKPIRPIRCDRSSHPRRRPADSSRRRHRPAASRHCRHRVARRRNRAGPRSTRRRQLAQSDGWLGGSRKFRVADARGRDSTSANARRTRGRGLHPVESRRL
jgi:hypothetical protein